MITNGNVELPGVKTVSNPLFQLSYYSLLILKGIVEIRDGQDISVEGMLFLTKILYSAANFG
jgi:hypothetical protein